MYTPGSARGLRLCVFALLLSAAASADQFSYTDTGGAVTLGSDFVITTSNLAAPAGTLSLSCPVTSIGPGNFSAQWTCVGGSLTLQSNDGSTAISGAFTTGLLTLLIAGGGHGNPEKYYYNFSGSFTGTLTQAGQSEAITGATIQSVATLTSALGTGTISSGAADLNGIYEPVYVADTANSRIVRTDDMSGDNWIALGKPGSGTLQFNQPWGILLDTAGKIYVSDSGNCRIVRMDDMRGSNWTAFGTCGAGTGQFNNPSGLFADTAGRIYVGDTGNNRIVRVDNITGANWISYGAAGSGTGQFAAPTGVSVDTSGRIYVADSNNSRIVRFDDFSGANWIALGTFGPGVNQFDYPSAISLDQAGRIYVADAINNRIARMDDMAGTNWAVLGGTLGAGVDQFVNCYGVYVDPFGSIYVGDTHNNRVVRSDDTSGLAWTSFGSVGLGGRQFNLPVGLFAAPPAVPTPVATLSIASLSYGNQVVGTPSAAQSVTVTNIGGAPLTITSVTSSPDFPVTDGCPATLAGGSSCAVSAVFQPLAPGTRTGSIAFSFAPSTKKSVSLKGIGTLVAVSPRSLNFGNVRAGEGRKTLTVTVSNPGAAAAAISSVAIQGPGVFHAKNQCPPSLAAGASCSVSVTFAPAATQYYTGKLIVTDGSGTAQNVALTGTGVSN